MKRSMGYNLNMYYVYVIKSKIDDRLYVGFSNELKQRIKSHNAGQSIYTAKYKPWKLIFYAAFENEKSAKEFEKYLKSHSGRAFIYKRLM
jgi:predicted GIY-YIG superfamily endonuclease